MKEYDVHFTVNFSDMFTGIEAESKEEAIQKAIHYLNYNLADRVIYLLEQGEGNGFEVNFTDTLEIGKDI